MRLAMRTPRIFFDIYRDYRSCNRDIEYEETGEMEHFEIAKLLDYDDFFRRTSKNLCQ